MTQQITSSIRIPYAQGERSKAYEAKVAYLLMGGYRNKADVAAKVNATITTVSAWAARYQWDEAAVQYDEAVAQHKIKLVEDAYRQDVEEYMKRYREVGRELQETAVELLQEMRARMRRPTFPVTQNTLGLSSRALLAAADLEAHSLRISEILPQFETVNEHGGPHEQ